MNNVLRYYVSCRKFRNHFFLYSGKLSRNVQSWYSIHIKSLNFIHHYRLRKHQFFSRLATRYEEQKKSSSNEEKHEEVVLTRKRGMQQTVEENTELGKIASGGEEMQAG